MCPTCTCFCDGCVQHHASATNRIELEAAREGDRRSVGDKPRCILRVETRACRVLVRHADRYDLTTNYIVLLVNDESLR